MKNTPLAILAVVLLLSCNPQRWCAKHAPPITGRDTTMIDTIIETVYDTGVRVRPDSSSIQALIECTGENIRIKEILNSHPGTNVLPPQITIKDRILYVDCKVDSNQIYITLKKRKEIHLERTSSDAVKVINQPTGFQQFRSWGFWIYTAILVIFLGWKFIVGKFGGIGSLLSKLTGKL